MAGVPDWASDDALISGDRLLLRRIPAELCHDGVIESSNFDEREEGYGLSVTLWESENDLLDVLRGHENFGVVCVSAATFRSEGAIIARRPLVGNLNHCEIFPRLKGNRPRRIKAAAQWVYYPAWVSFADRVAVVTLDG